MSKDKMIFDTEQTKIATAYNKGYNTASSYTKQISKEERKFGAQLGFMLGIFFVMAVVMIALLGMVIYQHYQNTVDYNTKVCQQYGYEKGQYTANLCSSNNEWYYQNGNVKIEEDVDAVIKHKVVSYK